MKLFACAILMAGAVWAQTAAPLIPRTASGKPDFQGIWQHPYVPDMSKDGRDQKGPGALPFSEKGDNDFKTYDVSKYDYSAHCLPFGLVRSQNAPYPIMIMQNDKFLAFLFEQSNWFNPVAIGRAHPADPNPNWFGDSIGKWEGDTFVIDTIAFNGKTRLDTIGHGHSDQLHVIQKMTMKDANHFDYEMTIDDPLYYTKPWTNTRVYTRMKPGDELIEYSCEENNKDLTDGHIK